MITFLTMTGSYSLKQEHRTGLATLLVKFIWAQPRNL